MSFNELGSEEINEYEMDENFDEENSADLENFELDEDDFEVGADDFEMDEDDFDSEIGDVGFENPLAERLYEVMQEDFENESDLDNRIDSLLIEPERQYFFGGLKKLVKKAVGGVKKLAKNKFVRGALKAGLGLAKSQIPGLGVAMNAATNLARGNLKGMLGDVMKGGLMKAGLSFIPGGGFVNSALPLLKSAGVNFSLPSGPAGSRRFANDLSFIANNSFQNLAKNIMNPEIVDLQNPFVAKRLAQQSIMDALRRASMTRSTFRPIPGRTSFRPSSQLFGRRFSRYRARPVFR